MKNKTHQELFEMIKADKLELETRLKSLQQSLINVKKSIQIGEDKGTISAKDLDNEIIIETRIEELKTQYLKLRNYHNLVKKDYVQKQEKVKRTQQVEQEKKDNTLPF